MTVTTREFAGFVLIAGVGVLGGAFVSQYWGGLKPCELCLWQRRPWEAAIVLALVGALAGSRLPMAGAALTLGLVFAVSAGLAFYHLGVEQHWFAGPTACTASGGGAKTVEEMRQLILHAAPVQCDQVQWSLFGVSLAGWNLLASLAMLACCVLAGWRSRRGTA
jgi:disulfide bond formation protein DsbB